MTKEYKGCGMPYPVDIDTEQSLSTMRRVAIRQSQADATNNGPPPRRDLEHSATMVRVGSRMVCSQLQGQKGELSTVPISLGLIINNARGKNPKGAASQGCK